MKTAIILAAAGMLSVVGIVWAEGRVTSNPATLIGKVVAVDGAKVTVKTWVRQTDSVIDKDVATDANTAVTVDGRPAAVADLRPGMRVTITPPDGTAARIVATAMGAPQTQPLQVRVGWIVRADANALVVENHVGGRTHTFQVPLTARTTVMLDGRPARVADLKPQMDVQIVPADGPAANIVARSKPAGQ